jgi:predicted DNA-binding protein YlxM (UPF0122 family)
LTDNIKNQTAIKEIERALRYREKELESFERKLELLKEQKEQYEKELIPQFKEEIKELEGTLEYLRFEEDLDLPF